MVSPGSLSRVITRVSPGSISLWVITMVQQLDAPMAANQARLTFALWS